MVGCGCLGSGNSYYLVVFVGVKEQIIYGLSSVTFAIANPIRSTSPTPTRDYKKIEESMSAGDLHNAWPRKVPIPKQYLCPLTKLLMEHPVIDREGNSYEKDAM